MGTIAFVDLGLIAVAIAEPIMPGGDDPGFLVMALSGIVGALLGGLLYPDLVLRRPARRGSSDISYLR